MRRAVEIDGTLLRRERESRSWTQERLSEESRLGVRTVRRLESGQGSLDSLRRVAEALSIDPSDAVLNMGSESNSSVIDDLRFDLLVVEFATDLCGEEFVKAFVDSVGRIRRHLYHQLGFLMPGIRFRDNLNLEPGHYRILVRERPLASCRLHLDKMLAVGGDLSSLDGEDCQDPTYSMPAKWIAYQDMEQAQLADASVFSAVNVMSAHLTQVVRENAYQLLGIEETAALLEDLQRPRTIQEVLPNKLSLTQLRNLLVELLKEQVSIRDLGQILELVADGEPGEALDSHLKRVRMALA